MLLVPTPPPIPSSVLKDRLLYSVLRLPTSHLDIEAVGQQPKRLWAGHLFSKARCSKGWQTLDNPLELCLKDGIEDVEDPIYFCLAFSYGSEESFLMSQ